ncbi:outer membrane beta-barrel protein [Roseomonas stagni]|uniref:Outer membrane beta-barrel protein n=1 Tax=Falsiroseomonas algicola TaxID=2716930 RepID=A0A6M1LUP3_9PROT|nr:outer membrane beta-barrel protein [Falsiroseomonas algicola]NGM24205.1 outer membrane beta-barrel protein [Falsiroseomonas algicola]
MLQRLVLPLGVLAFMAPALTAPGGALAQGIDSRLPTDKAEDPRRQGNSARVTQERSPENDRTGENDAHRVAPAYIAPGVRVGNFIINPFVEAEGRYNSNIFAQPAARSDFITRVTAAGAARSDLPVHAVNASARIDSYTYSRYSSEDRVDGEVTANGRLDISRDAWIYGGAAYFSTHEDRGSPDDRRGREPTRASGYVAESGSVARFGAISLGADIQATRREFDDVSTSTGTPIRNSLRDRWEFVGAARAAYEFFPGYAAVARVEGNIRNYDSSVDTLGFNRDSRGFRTEAGIGVDLTQLIRADFLVGYLQQDYEDNRLRDASGFSTRGVLNWTPSRLTVVAASLDRTVVETVTNASSVVRTAGSVVVRHELARNTVLTGSAYAAYDEFSGLPREDTTVGTLARITYALTPNLYVTSSAGYRRRTSTAPDNGFNESIIALRIGARL